MSQRSALDRLRELPEAFLFNDFCRLQDLSPDSAQVTLNRWKKQSLIAPAGPRAAIYYNLLKAPQGPETLRHLAIHHYFPEAVLAGASVLSYAGWTTQYCHLIEVNTFESRQERQLFGVGLHQRPLAWFQRLHAAGQLLPPNQVDFHTAGLRTLSPAFALADCFADDTHWQPHPDDLDIEPRQVREALRAWDVLYPGKPLPAALDDLAAYFAVDVAHPARRGDRRFMDNDPAP